MSLNAKACERSTVARERHEPHEWSEDGRHGQDWPDRWCAGLVPPVTAESQQNGSGGDDENSAAGVAAGIPAAAHKRSEARP